jgi:hypothetical protein
MTTQQPFKLGANAWMIGGVYRNLSWWVSFFIALLGEKERAIYENRNFNPHSTQ